MRIYYKRNILFIKRNVYFFIYQEIHLLLQRGGPPKNREAPALCGRQVFFGLIIPAFRQTGLLTFFDQAKKVRIDSREFQNWDEI
jgi:hypothetical protein